MALSYQTTWDSITGSFESQSEVTDALFGFISDPFDYSCFSINSLFNPEPETDFHSEKPTPLSTLTHSSFSLSTLPTLYQTTIPSLYQNPYIPNVPIHHSTSPSKWYTLSNDGQKNFYNTGSLPGLSSSLSPPRMSPSYQNHYNPNVPNHHSTSPSKRYKLCNDGQKNFYGTSSLSSPSSSLSPPRMIPSYDQFNMGKVVPKWESEMIRVSAQSMAARQRRKKISDKTQELGKLIPGGTRMNSAEMFQAAFNYVKFLRAQIGILALMNSNEVGEVPATEDERMHILLNSTNLQEKFYAEGKCLVPKKMVESLAKDRVVRSSVFVSRDLDRFVESIKSRM